jgi:glutamyl-tRNA reductase
MRVGVVGVNHKIAGVKLREALAKACQRRFGSQYTLHGDHHFILLSTCNRTEVYFSSEDLAATHIYLLGILRNEVDEEFDQKLYSYFGKDCFLHLSRVASGLDSAIIAETEIQGQVKGAYEAGAAYQNLPKEIHYLFQKSIMLSKQVRTDLQLGRGMPSLENAIYKCGKKFFQPDQARILFIGVSEINRKILRYLKEKRYESITICNRSYDALSSLSKAEGVHALQWDQLSQWHEYDWLIVGTKAPNYLIKDVNVPTIIKTKLIIDLGVPRNVDPSIGERGGVTVLNIDEIIQTLAAHTEQMTHNVGQAERMIADATRNHIVRFRDKERFQIHDLAVIGA